jgi:hypothetical protein
MCAAKNAALAGRGPRAASRFIEGLTAPGLPFLPSRKIARYEIGKSLFLNTFKAIFLPSGCNLV